MPAGRREVELLITCDDVEAAKKAAIDLCTNAFAITPFPVWSAFVQASGNRSMTRPDVHAGFGSPAKCRTQTTRTTGTSDRKSVGAQVK